MGWVCAAPSSIAPTYRPGEAEGKADGIAEGGVGAARAVGHAEGVGAQDGGDGAAVGAGRLGGHAGLVVLEADAEEGLAVALLEPAGAGAAPAAAVAVAEQPLLIDKLLQLQLEDPGGADLRGGDSARQPPSSPLPCPTPAALAAPPCSSGLQQAATVPGISLGTPRCRDPLVQGFLSPTPRTLTWQWLSSTERTASVSRNRPPILEVQLWCPRFPPLYLLVRGKRGKCLSGLREKTQRPEPLVPAELEELVSLSPSFRSVSDFFSLLSIPLDVACRQLSGLSDGKRKREEKRTGKKFKIYLLNSFSFAIHDAPPFLQEKKIKKIKAT